MMPSLKCLIYFKIVFTLIFWCLPLLTLPSSWFRWVGLPAPQPILFVRLLGAAFFALLVGYWFGLNEIERKQFPYSAAWVSLVSNGSASLILCGFGLAGSWKSWRWLARFYLWFSALATMFIALGMAYWLRQGHL